MPLRSSAPPNVATPSRPAKPGLILAILATASFVAELDLCITNVGLSSARGTSCTSNSPRRSPTTSSGFLNS